MQYTMWEQTPMKWHRLVAFLGLPVSILTAVSLLPSYIQTFQSLLGTGLEWVGVLDILYIAATVGVSATAMVGLICKRWLGVRCLLAGYLLPAGYAAYYLVLGAVLHFDGRAMGQYAGMIVIDIPIFFLVRYYYKKRRLLFAPPPFVTVLDRGEGPDVEPCVELRSHLLDEAAKERWKKEEAAGGKTYGPLDPPERRQRGTGAPVWLAAVLGGLCVILAVVVGVLGLQNVRLQRNYTAEVQKCGELEDRVSRMKETVSIAQAKAEEERLARAALLNNTLIETADRYIELLRQNSAPSDEIDWELADAAAKYMDAKESGGAILALRVDAYIEQLKNRQDEANDFVIELELAWASRAYEAAKANMVKGG